MPEEQNTHDITHPEPVLGSLLAEPTQVKPLVRQGERRRHERPTGPETAKQDEQFRRVILIHKRFGDDPAFRELFYERTSEALERLKTLMPSRETQTETGDQELSIIAEVEATFLAEKEMLKNAAEKDSITDPLTGAYNRRGFDQKLLEAFDGVRTSGKSATLAELDLDHFKRVNDTLGHDGGDIVLEKTVEFLKQVLGDKGYIGRYGGEEFYILFQNMNPQETKDFLEGIRGDMPKFLRTQLSEKQINTDHQLTASWGVAALSAETSIEDAKKATDTALYAAKQNGRNRVVSFEDIELEERAELNNAVESIKQRADLAAKELIRRMEESPYTRWQNRQVSPSIPLPEEPQKI